MLENCDWEEKKSSTLHWKLSVHICTKLFSYWWAWNQIVTANRNLSSIQSGYCICMKCCKRFFSIVWLVRCSILSECFYLYHFVFCDFFHLFIYLSAQDYEWMLVTIAYTSFMEFVVLNCFGVQKWNKRLINKFATLCVCSTKKLLEWDFDKKINELNLTTRFKQISST